MHREPVLTNNTQCLGQAGHGDREQPDPAAAPRMQPGPGRQQVQTPRDMGRQAHGPLLSPSVLGTTQGRAESSQGKCPRGVDVRRSEPSGTHQDSSDRSGNFVFGPSFITNLWESVPPVGASFLPYKKWSCCNLPFPSQSSGDEMRIHVLVVFLQSLDQWLFFNTLLYIKPKD